MEPIYFFNSVEHLEVRCRKCQSKIDYGVTTTWNERKKSHVCNCCGEVV